MWHAYWSTVSRSGMDWLIYFWGISLMLAHLYGLFMRWQSKSPFYVQGLDRYRTMLLALTELLPVLGLTGTVLSLMATFQGFESTGDETPDMAATIRTFAPALSATCSGLLLVAPNLILNTLLWLACPQPEKDEVVS